MMMGKKAMAMMLMMSITMVLTMNWAHGQIVICGIQAQAFMPCLPALKQPSPSPPTPQCCGVVKQGDEKCLCSYATSPLLPAYGIDPTLFLALFGKCGLPSCPKA